MDDIYRQDLASVHAEAFEALAASAAETLRQFLVRGAPSCRVLDLGCGAGPLSRQLSEQGFSTRGLDLSPALIAMARKRLPGAEFQCGSILDVRLPKAAAAAAVGEVLNLLPSSLLEVGVRLAGVSPAPPGRSRSANTRR